MKGYPVVRKTKIKIFHAFDWQKKKKRLITTSAGEGMEKLALHIMQMGM